MQTISQKMIRRESCDSHSANIQCLPSKPSNTLNGYEAANRNNKMEENLHSKNLTTVEINADGNCFYRAISYALLGNQDSHDLIRQDIATHVEKRGTVIDGIIVSNSSEFSEYISKLRTLGNYKYIREDNILAACDLYQKEIQIYTSLPEPLLYYPSFGGQPNETIKLALHEPDH